jgi:allantoinase
MAKLELKIVNGRLATVAGVFPVDIGVRDGKIAAVGDWGALPDADEWIEAEGKVIMPGGIDAHVHAGDPGFFDFRHSTQAAALGGVTTVVDMPIQIPNTTDPESFDVKFAAISPKAYVDFALWATVDPDNIAAIIELKEKGVVGFKLVMQESVAGLMPHHHDGVILEALPEVKKAGLVANIHAESQDMILHLERKLKAEGRMDPQAFLDTHPVITELEAISRILFIAEHLGARINVAHCSLPEGIDMIDNARAKGQRVTVETCIHYLTLDNSIFETRGTFPKLAPPLRDKERGELMWQKIRQGKVDLVGSDHVPYPLSFKERDIWETAAGAPGIQTMFPLMITEGVNKGRITLPQMVKVMSEGPARVCGLYPRKGSAEIGSDADFAIFDLEHETGVRLEDQVGLEWTLYEGKKVVYPDRVLVRGKTVVDEGRIVGEQGYGAYVTPQ